MAEVKVNPLSAAPGEFGIPAVLKLLRGYYRMSQHELADQLGLNHGHYNRVEAGHRALGFQYWEKVCEVFRLSMGELYVLIYDSIPDNRRKAGLAMMDTEEVLSIRAEVLRRSLEGQAANEREQLLKEMAPIG